VTSGLVNRKTRVNSITVAGVWLVGLIAIWWLTPFGPRDGWQLPEDEFVCGFLKDCRTLVTVPHANIGFRSSGMWVTGPIRLWDIETGELRAVHAKPNGGYRKIEVIPGHDLLKAQRRNRDSGEHDFRLQLLDAWTGNEVAGFDCRDPYENIAWLDAVPFPVEGCWRLLGK
jgi:hypothetical protein